MSADQRRRHGVFARIVDDPWRKLLAIGLAVLLWFFIDNQITRTIKLPMPLVVVGAQGNDGRSVDRLAVALPLDRVVAGRFFDGQTPIDHVDVLLTGPRYRIAAFEDNSEKRLDLLITSFLDLPWAERTKDWTEPTSIEFNAADINRDQRGLEEVKIQIVPSSIRLDVEPLARLQVPLTLDVVDLDEGDLKDRVRRDTAKFAPDTAVVFGPAFAINDLRNAAKKFRADMRGVGSDKQATVTLELISSPGQLRVETRPQLTIQVQPLTTKAELDLLVFVDDLSLPPKERGLYQPVEPTKLVRVRLGGDLRMALAQFDELPDRERRRAEWAKDNLRLYVHLPKPKDGARYEQEIDISAQLRVAGRLAEKVDRSECLLEDTVVVKLQRRTQ